MELTASIISANTEPSLTAANSATTTTANSSDTTAALLAYDTNTSALTPGDGGSVTGIITNGRMDKNVFNRKLTRSIQQSFVELTVENGISGPLPDYTENNLNDKSLVEKYVADDNPDDNEESKATPTDTNSVSSDGYT